MASDDTTLGTGGDPQSPAGVLRFHVYDAEGRRLDWRSFRTLQENGQGDDGDNDLLVDPDTLTAIQAWPLYEDRGEPALKRPAGPVALSLAWPTPDGYSALILDLPRPGTYVFNELAATQAVNRIGAQLADRPGYRPSRAFSLTWRTARSELAQAKLPGPEAERGRHGTRAYEAAVHAQLLLLQEYGVQSAGSRRAGAAAPKASRGRGPAAERGVPVTGFTFDARPGPADLQRVSALVGGERDVAAVRLVFHLHESPDHYAATVRAAHAAGIQVVGQILDSSDMAAMSQVRWQRRVARFVLALPGVDIWEVGNEVNGNWLGAGVLDKIAYAAEYVKEHTRASTLLTLYWQLGEDVPANSLFTWAASLPASTLAHIDQVGLSVYPEEHPLGAAFDRVFQTLHRRFPRQRLGVTELGYWSADLAHTWWWGSQSDPTGAGRSAVAMLYARAVLGYPYSSGGTYWWYFLTEAGTETRLYQAFAAVQREVAGGGLTRGCVGFSSH
jgi:hypothetical protein